MFDLDVPIAESQPKKPKTAPKTPRRTIVPLAVHGDGVPMAGDTEALRVVGGAKASEALAVAALAAKPLAAGYHAIIREALAHARTQTYMHANIYAHVHACIHALICSLCISLYICPGKAKTARADHRAEKKARTEAAKAKKNAQKKAEKKAAKEAAKEAAQKAAKKTKG